MSVFVYTRGARQYRADAAALDITIPLDFDGPQPSFYDADPATARPMHSGQFIGDTRLGGSCNAEHIDLVAHCNGTHTECVGHITHERVSVHTLATEPLYPCRVVSVDLRTVRETDEHGGPFSDKTDLLITRAALSEALGEPDTPALAIRTLPNTTAKRTRVYKTADTPYFSVEAMSWIVDAGVEHLLVDTPSVDRLIDDGRMTTHRIFWGMKPGSRSVDDAARPRATITELIFVPEHVSDGLYLLDLQVAPFISDAAPSRALLYAVRS